MADVDGTVAGFSHVMILEQKNIACLKPQTAVYIQDLAVLESERNKGIGTLLIKASKEYGKKEGQILCGRRFFRKILTDSGFMKEMVLKK